MTAILALMILVAQSMDVRIPKLAAMIKMSVLMIIVILPADVFQLQWTVMMQMYVLKILATLPLVVSIFYHPVSAKMVMPVPIQLVIPFRDASMPLLLVMMAKPVILPRDVLLEIFLRSNE
jgi:hypothetical protein